MWIAKFKIYDKNNEFRKIVEDIKVEVYYYPVNYYIKENRYFFIAVGIVREDKDKFFREIKKLKKVRTGRRLELLEVEENFFTIITSHTMNQEEKKYVKHFYNSAIIHNKPIIFHKDGWEEWEIASLEKNALTDLIEAGKKIYELEVLRFYWKKMKNFGFLSILPELTEKQEKALELAFKWGYYKYPRDISAEKLAKLAKVSFSTFQAHIRKAENKILSFVISSFKG